MYISTKFAQELFSKDRENEFHREDPGIAGFSPKGDNVFYDMVNQLPKDLSVSLPGEDQYKADINHWATSSSQESACTVQPDTAEDVSRILKFINTYRLPNGSRIPFGVKSGGHTGNPGFSSSPGVLISMTRFNKVVYQADSKTAVIGAGQIWDNVYEKLVQHNVTVLGARVTHIGVAGFILGGGYSWKTNQFGLAMDTVTAFELVKTDGTITNVTVTSDPDLFFALRGGGNNFGIVTAFTMKTFPQGPVWGGPILLLQEPDDNDDLEKDEVAEKIKKLFFAVQSFIDRVTDPKAAILASLGTFGGPSKIINLIAFYDGPSPPAGIFDIFKEIAPKEVADGWVTRSYLELVQSAAAYDQSLGYRGGFHTVGLSHYTTNLLQAIWDENEYWGPKLTYDTASRILITYSVEPFLPDILSHGSPSAYPYDRSVAFSPFPIYVSWKKPAFDRRFHDFLKEATYRIQKEAEDGGIKIGTKYPNYAVFDTPLDEIYGTNTKKLKEIKAKVDPSNVMGLAGGFKF